jgi:hypothetical protein
MKIKHKYMYNDWVMVDGKFYQIQSWTKKKIGIHKTPSTMSYVRLSEVQPIPLTEEILLLNGFKVIDDYQGYKQFYNYMHNTGVQFGGVGFYTVIDGKLRRLNYVHDVQHMYEWREVDYNWIMPKENLEN